MAEMKKINPLEPSASVLIKIASINVHVEEMLSPTGHVFDKFALKGLLADPEVKEWLKAMDKLALLPKKRQDSRQKGGAL